MIILQISPVNTKKKRNGAIRSGSLRTPASRVSLKQEKCVRQIKVCSSTVFECGFSWITARFTVKVRMESNLPVSPNANPPPPPPRLCCLSELVCDLLYHLHTTTLFPSPPRLFTPSSVNTARAPWQHMRRYDEKRTGASCCHWVFFLFFCFFTTAFREKKKLLWKIFWSRVQQWERNMRLMWRASGCFMLLQVFKAGWQ